ncbi:hypothetical protein [uncultured Kordia sp.]|uniref:hypothetical protein n=1 Tax=uncultured Kordia sp. TaxID=507699 RepID=UPI002618E61F|nr:hypothetical protein [uncultured Kordia sp.]
MNNTFLTIILVFFVQSFAFGQFSRENIETDSSNIKIVRNSAYKTYTETYKHKNLEWYSVHFIKDTTRLHTEGWSLKDGENIGVWNEYNFDGELLFTRDYDNATCTINKTLFPFHNLLEKMKKKADQLIIDTYSKTFFDNHVRFNFDCTAHDKDGYVGNWTEPMKRKPTEFLFQYQVKLKTSKWYDEMITIELDEQGTYILKKGIGNNYGFEKATTKHKTFQIDEHKALDIAKTKGLKVNPSEEVIAFLTWESFRTKTFFNGQFMYYIIELTKEIKDIKEKGRSKIIYKYNVYTFNPWSGEFIEKKKMKRVKTWGQRSGFTSGLLPDD